MTEISLIEFSLVAVNTATGLVLGASTGVAVKVLPFSEKKRWIALAIVTAVWATAVTIVSVLMDPPDSLIARRFINALVLGWVAVLLILQARYNRRQRNKESHGTA